MSFLWCGKKLKLSTISKKMKPSPTNSLFPRAMSQVPCLHEHLANAARVRYPAAVLRCKFDAPSACCGVFDFLRDFAQSPLKTICGVFSRVFLKCRAIERISLLTFRGRMADAGMTVEAAVVMPLFLCFLVNLGCAVELIRLHGNLQLALWDTCGKMAVYGHALGDNKTASVFSWFYLKNQLADYVGRDYLDNAPIKRGTEGLSLLDGKLFSDGDEMDVAVVYRATPLAGLAAFTEFSMANRCFIRLWTGYGIPQNPEEALRSVDVVYVAENGEVYHEDRNCTHLTLSVREVTASEAESARNRWGGRYSPCEKCRPEVSLPKLYITPEGDRYHGAAECPGLKRTVFSVPRSSAAGYRACSRCG